MVINVSTNIHELKENLISVIKNKKIKRKRKTIQSIKTGLQKYDLLNIQETINNPDVEIPNMKEVELLLLAEQLFIETSEENIKPSKYFSEYEMKRARQYRGTSELDEEIEFPYTFKNVNMIDHDTFNFELSSREIARLSNSRKLHYNFNIQRESQKKNINGRIVEEITVIPESVLQIKNNIIKGKQYPSQLIINAAVFSADDGMNELKYDPAERTLTVMPGTILDIADGYHRTKGSEMAYSEDKNAEVIFTILLTNYPDDKAKEMVGQHSLATPISDERRLEMMNSGLGDEVLNKFLKESLLDEKVGRGKELNKNLNEVVKYSTLRNTIQNFFNLERTGDRYRVADYLKEFFNILIEETDSKNKENSMLNEEIMYVGFIILASRMMNKQMKAYEVLDILEVVDFRKDDDIWKEFEIVDSKLNVKNSIENMEKLIDNLI